MARPAPDQRSPGERSTPASGQREDTKTPRPLDGASSVTRTIRVGSDGADRGEARECERRNGEDAHERVEARAGRSHTNLQSGNPADSGGGRSRDPSPVALRPRVTPGLPFSADPRRAGTALAVCHDPTPRGCACAPSNPSHRRAVPWSGGPHGTRRCYGRGTGRMRPDGTPTRAGRRAAVSVGRGGWIALGRRRGRRASAQCDRPADGGDGDWRDRGRRPSDQPFGPGLNVRCVSVVADIRRLLRSAASGGHLRTRCARDAAAAAQRSRSRLRPPLSRGSRRRGPRG